jgi:hypothetical protein
MTNSKSKKSIKKPKKVVEAKRYVSNESLLESIKGLLEDKLTNFKNSKISLSDSFIDEYNTCVLEVHGGLNGSGNWSMYFEDLKKLCDTITKSTDGSVRVWLIQLENDCLDDVFTAYFGIGADIKPEE